jgi:small subunit ribosomal protein S20
LANSDQALKRARQAEKRRQQNTAQRSMLRTHVKKAAQAIATGDLETAKAVYQAAMPVVDRLADKGIVHKNKAARHKSRLNARLKALAQARTTG